MSTVTMSEQCNCIDLTNEALRPHNTHLGLAFQISRNTGGISTTIGIETELIEKKRGAKPMRILASFCPFCGTAYAREEATS